MPESATRAHRAAKRYIYAWGDGQAEGNGDDEGPARRQGRRPRRDDQRRPADPARLHDHDRGLQRLLRRRQAAARRPLGRRPRRRAARSSSRPARASATRRTRSWSRVRSGAKFSMPGMMDTVLNLGLNEETLHGPHRADAATSASAGTPTAASSRCSAASSWTSTASASTHALDAAKENARRERQDTDLDAADLASSSPRSRRSSATPPGRDFPTDPNEQLDLAIKAVFASWFGKRANDYRNSQKIAHDLGTAVNVVTMVFGNMGDDSGTGVAFTRDPNTGEKELYGEYLVNAQGEDVVAGIRTPQKISQLADGDARRRTREFQQIADQLEQHYRDVQDLEFTIERGQPLHAPDAQREADRRGGREDRRRHGRRGRHHQGTRRSRASSRPRSTSSCATSSTRPPARPPRRIAKGLNASPGAAVGKAVFDADVAVEWVAQRREGRPRPRRDVPGRLPRHGRRAGHPDRPRRRHVARGRRRPPDRQAVRRRLRRAGRRLRHARRRTAPNGAHASPRATGSASTARPARSSSARCRRSRRGSRTSPSSSEILGWADEIRRLQVWTNADKPEEAAQARSLRRPGHRPLPHRAHVPRGRAPGDRARRDPRRERGHPGQGEGRRGRGARRRTSRPSSAEFDAAMAKLEVLQQGDFEGILAAMSGLPGRHPPDRPAAPRVPAEPRGPARQGHRRRGEHAGDRPTEARSCSRPSSRCTSRTRCSACAAAASA